MLIPALLLQVDLHRNERIVPANRHQDLRQQSDRCYKQEAKIVSWKKKKAIMRSHHKFRLFVLVDIVCLANKEWRRQNNLLSISPFDEKFLWSTLNTNKIRNASWNRQITNPKKKYTVLNSEKERGKRNWTKIQNNDVWANE